MNTRALPEEQLHRFLRRQRKGTGWVRPAPLGLWLGETLELAARFVPAQGGALLLDDPGRRRGRSPLFFVAAFGPAEHLVGSRLPAGRGIAGHVYRHGETYVSDAPAEDPLFFPRLADPSGFRTRSLIAAPIRLERTVCGVFELLNRRGRHGFSDRDIALVELFARYVSRAILNAVDILKHNELALRDELTGVGNVRGLEPTLQRALREADDVAVLFIDVDRLKRINDRLGHRAGSEVLRRTGRALEQALGPRGSMFRFGGDEFVAVCPGADVDTAERIARELRDAVGKATPGPLPGTGKLPRVSVSAGIATLRDSLALDDGVAPAPSEASARLLAAADRALYRAKRRGRRRSARATRRDDTLR